MCKKLSTLESSPVSKLYDKSDQMKKTLSLFLFYWAESESLESKLACVGVLVLPLCVVPECCRDCVLLLRLSSDCKKERLARSSSSGEAPSSSTSAISAKVTGWVLKRASRGRLGRLRPRAGPLGTGSCCGNSSIAEAIKWAGSIEKPTVSTGRTAIDGDGRCCVFIRWGALFASPSLLFSLFKDSRANFLSFNSCHSKTA